MTYCLPSTLFEFACGGAGIDFVGVEWGAVEDEGVMASGMIMGRGRGLSPALQMILGSSFVMSAIWSALMGLLRMITKGFCPIVLVYAVGPCTAAAWLDFVCVGFFGVEGCAFVVVAATGFKRAPVFVFAEFLLVCLAATG